MDKDRARAKLIEWIREAQGCYRIEEMYADIDTLIDLPREEEHIADHLIAHGVTIQRWIPVSERLPEKGGYYLICQKDKKWFDEVIQVARYHSQLENFRGAQSGSRMEYVTHWMPLPEPPKELTDGEV